MFGSVSGYSHSPYYVSLSAQVVARSTQFVTPPQESSTTVPVQPVAPTREVVSNGDKFSVEAMMNQHASDPVAMAARMRIQYPGQTPANANENAKSAQEIFEEGECQTCENRKYQDGSDDPGVSFKTATHLSPEQAATAVRGHEMEHVVREQAKASREDRQVISQSVTIQTAICPECGTVYASGGTTTTVTKANNAPQSEPTEPPKAA